MSRSKEAFWWSLFVTGGVLASLFIPAFVIITGFLLPTGETELAGERYEYLSGLLSSGLTKVLLVVVVGFGFFHCAHRIRHMAIDLGLQAYAAAVAAICYGGATVGLAASIMVVLRL